MDILGPFPLSKKGNRYIVVAVDYVTKWADAVALPAAGGMEVAEFFVHEILLRYGAPRSLTTDQEKCFVARMMQWILQVLQTNHRTTTAYHQQTNGQVERLNHTFADMLSMYMNADH
jgi:transposase InsO family protein